MAIKQPEDGFINLLYSITHKYLYWTWLYNDDLPVVWLKYIRRTFLSHNTKNIRKRLTVQSADFRWTASASDISEARRQNRTDQINMMFVGSQPWLSTKVVVVVNDNDNDNEVEKPLCM